MTIKHYLFNSNVIFFHVDALSGFRKRLRDRKWIIPGFCKKERLCGGHEGEGSIAPYVLSAIRGEGEVLREKIRLMFYLVI